MTEGQERLLESSEREPRYGANLHSDWQRGGAFFFQNSRFAIARPTLLQHFP
jgi:hypothetical protein